MKSKDILADLSLDEIITIIKKRKILPEDKIEYNENKKLEYIGLISYDQKNLEHTIKYFNQISWKEKNLLMFIQSEGGVVEENFLIDAYYLGNKNVFKNEITNLLEFGFLYLDPFYVKRFGIKLYGIPESYQQYIQVPIFLEGKLGFYLSLLEKEVLTKIQYDFFQEGLECQFKDYLIYKIKSILLNPATLEKSLNKLPILKQKVITTVMEFGGQLWLSDILKKLGINKKPDAALRNLIWNNSFLYITLQKNKDYLIRIPSDIFYLMKNKSDRIYTYQDALNTFIDKKVYNKQTKVTNSYDWYKDFIYILNTIQQDKLNNILFRGFSKKQHSFIKQQDYKGVPYIVFFILLAHYNGILTIKKNNIKINDLSYKLSLSSNALLYQLTKQWINNYLFLEVFDKKYLRIEKYEKLEKEDIYNIKSFKIQLIRVLKDLPSNKKIRIDSLFKLFFDNIKIKEFYKTFDYNIANFFSFTKEQIEHLKNLIRGPLFWLGIINIINKEKLEYFFEQLTKSIDLNHSVNSLIKQNAIPKIDAFIEITKNGKNVLTSSLEGLTEKESENQPQEKISFDRNKNIISVSLNNKFDTIIKLSLLGEISDIKNNIIEIKLDKKKLNNNNIITPKDLSQLIDIEEDFETSLKSETHNIVYLINQNNFVIIIPHNTYKKIGTVLKDKYPVFNINGTHIILVKTKKAYKELTKFLQNNNFSINELKGI